MKLITIALFCVLMPSLVFAGQQSLKTRGKDANPGSSANVLLANATTTGAGADTFVNEKPYPSTHLVSCVITEVTTPVTALTVELQHTEDGTNWFTAASHVLTAGELAAKQADIVVASYPMGEVQINITTLTGGAGSGDYINCSYTPGN